MREVVIYVRGGVAYWHSKPDDVEVKIIDWDNLEQGGCPNCGKDRLHSEATRCGECGFDWSEYE